MGAADSPFGPGARPWHLTVATGECSAGSRVGGNPPACFHRPELARYLDTHRYLLTLGDEFSMLTGGYDLSVLLPAGFTVSDDDTRYPDIGIACLLHPPAPAAPATAGRLDAISAGKLVRLDPHLGTQYLIKIGGSPDWIQEEPDLYERNLVADGFSFLFQLDEWGYPDDFVAGDYPLSFGGLYVYGKFDDNGMITRVTAGFTQFS